MNILKKAIYSAVIIFFVAGCAAKRAVATFPDVGAITTKGIGESLLLRGNGIMHPVLVTQKDQTVGSFVLRQGRYISTGENSSWVKFGVVENVSTIDSIAKKATIYMNKLDGKVCPDKDNCVAVEYKLEAVMMNFSSQSFQQTLLYNGKVGNKITLAYREFSNNFARPAFSNSVDYDLSETVVLGYKGARIEVIKADNSSITYKVLSGFD